MKIFVYLILISLWLFGYPAYSQSTITFDNQGWTSDQSIDTIFTIDNFTFSSNKSVYTNYGYNFDVNNVSIYYAFQNSATDHLTITTLNNESISLSGLAVYQVSEISIDTLIIEGWNGSNKIYSRSFSNLNTWQILSINFTNINKISFRIADSDNNGITDFNFDNFVFIESEVPVELIEFKANTEMDHIALEWRTVTELNNYGFDIERKDTHTDWNRIGFVEGSGTTVNPMNYSFSDYADKEESKYRYRLKMIDNNGDYNYSDEIEVLINLIPEHFTLDQNFPNPFNPRTIISWQSPVSSWQTLKVYDILGNEVATLVDEQKEAGSYSVTFDAVNLSSGIYIYKLSTDTPSSGSGQSFVSTKKMLMIK